MSITTTILSGALLIFILGVLTGNGLITRTQDARDRRQAARQRQLNDEFRVLREQQEARLQRERLDRLWTSAKSSDSPLAPPWPRGPVPR